MIRKCNLLFIFLFISLFFFGCDTPELINASNGSIPIQGESSYVDGNYLVHSAYYDTAGYGQILSLHVTNGLITSVQFIEQNASGDKKQSFDQANITNSDKTEYLQFINSLTTALIQHQSSESLTRITNDNFSIESYITMVDKALVACQSGDQTPLICDLNQSYTATLTSTDPSYLTGNIKITYKDGDLVDVTGKIENTLTSSDSNEALHALFFESTMQNKNLNPLSGTDLESSDLILYNQLLNLISEQRKVFTPQ